MSWSKPFKGKDPETGKTTVYKVKTDETGAVTDYLQGVEKDTKDKKAHDHVWGLGPYSKKVDGIVRGDSKPVKADDNKSDKNKSKKGWW